VSTGRSPETSGPSSLNAPTPNVGDRRGGNPRHERGVLRARLLRPAGRHAMVVAHFFESGQRRRLRWGRVESAPLMAGAVALASTGYIAAIDEKAWAGPRRLGPASRFPQREPHCPRRQLESRVREAQGRVILWSGAGFAAQLRPPGTGCSPANGTPEELRRLARPCVLSIALPLRFYYDLPKRPPKISGCLRIERNTNILGRPATGRVTSRRIGRSRLKRHPQFVR